MRHSLKKIGLETELPFQISYLTTLWRFHQIWQVSQNILFCVNCLAFEGKFVDCFWFCFCYCCFDFVFFSSAFNIIMFFLIILRWLDAICKTVWALWLQGSFPLAWLICQHSSHSPLGMQKTYPANDASPSYPYCVCNTTYIVSRCK